MDETVLIVEDSRTVAYDMARHLDAQGYKTVLAATVKDARKQMASSQADAVLLDVMLPDGSGLDILEEFKAEECSPAVLVLTGKGSAKTVSQAMRAGADDYMVKPVPKDDLDRFLRQALERRRLRISQRKGAGSRDTVLVVEDSTQEADIVEDRLDHARFRSLVARDANEALTITERVHVDVVLLDLYLPDSFGLDILPQLKESASRPAIIVVTGRGTEELAVESMHAGADDYMVKPVTGEELNETICSAVEQRRRKLADSALAQEASADLTAAAAVQTQLGQTEIPEVPGWQIAARLVPARTVGGDTMGIVQYGDHLHLWIGDISGKGMGAAVLASSVRTLIRNQAALAIDPELIVNSVARLAYDDMARSDAFLTLFFSTINVKTGEALVIDAGHGHARIRHAGGKWEEVGCPPAMPVGISAEPGYFATGKLLNPGDHLVVFTDGLVELGEQPDTKSGTQHLIESIDGAIFSRNTGIDQICGAVFDSVEGIPKSDDRTLLILEREFGLGPVAISLKVELDELDRINELVARLNRSGAIDDDSAFAVELALTEAFTNIVRHGHSHHLMVKRDVTLELTIEDGTLRCRFEDGGVPFKPDEISESLDLESDSGRGIQVIEGIMDTVSYLRENEVNVLTMTKSIK